VRWRHAGRPASLGRLLLALALLAPLAAAHAQTAPFPAGTARVVPDRRVEVGVFAPLRLGLRDRYEVAIHPAWALVAPNLDLKIAWGTRRSVSVASTHGVLYPTPLLRLLSREGTGGIVPHDVTYPHVLATSHHLLATLDARGHLLTLRAGARLAWNLTRFDGPRSWSQIEWHLVWPRAAAWFTGFSADVGVAVQGPIARGLGYRVEVDRFFMPGLRGDWAYEWAGILSWRASPRLLVRGGAKWSYAEFPYGVRLSPPFPLVDVVWALDRRR
jgi:hypothetical protein